MLQNLDIEIKIYFAIDAANNKSADQTVSLILTRLKTGVIMNRLNSIADLHMRNIIRKPASSICENKGVDQLHSNHIADQRLCFRYIDSTITLLPKSEI